MSDSSSILTDERAAVILGTTARRVRTWVRRGLLPGRELPDGSIVIALTDLQRWVAATDSPSSGEAVADAC
jgi:hypothetical protein